jgi:hypothetical protein
LRIAKSVKRVPMDTKRFKQVMQMLLQVMRQMFGKQKSPIKFEALPTIEGKEADGPDTELRPQVEEKDVTLEDIPKLTLKKLKEALADRGLDTKGKKKALVAELERALKEEAAALEDERTAEASLYGAKGDDDDEQEEEEAPDEYNAAQEIAGMGLLQKTAMSIRTSMKTKDGGMSVRLLGGANSQRA